MRWEIVKMVMQNKFLCRNWDILMTKQYYVYVYMYTQYRHIYIFYTHLCTFFNIWMQGVYNFSVNVLDYPTFIQPLTPRFNKLQN